MNLIFLFAFERCTIVIMFFSGMHAQAVLIHITQSHLCDCGCKLYFSLYIFDDSTEPSCCCWHAAINSLPSPLNLNTNEQSETRGECKVDFPQSTIRPHELKLRSRKLRGKLMFVNCNKLIYLLSNTHVAVCVLFKIFTFSVGLMFLLKWSFVSKGVYTLFLDPDLLNLYWSLFRDDEERQMCVAHRQRWFLLELLAFILLC